MPLVSFEETVKTLEKALTRAGVPAISAGECAGIIAESTFDGVLSHGVRLAPTLLQWIAEGQVDPKAEPVPAGSFGALERWDGGHGIGILNAVCCTDRAMEIASVNGIGCVALRNTSHWFRAGSYAWRAAEAGYGLICWTNTLPNMPAWGAAKKSVGNNPLAVGVPHAETPLVLDIAMSQFALGALRLHAEEGRELPVPGGYDADGRLSTDPGRIVESGRVLPMGFWKGSGLAVVLDALAAILAEGSSTADHAREGVERSISQVFIAFDVRNSRLGDACVTDIVRLIHENASAGEHPYAPGEGTLARRRKNRKTGMDIDDGLWGRIQAAL